MTVGLFSTPETIAAFRRWEALLDAQYLSQPDAFSTQGLRAKLCCLREYPVLASFSPMGLEWGLQVEQHWQEGASTRFASAHVFLLEPWTPEQPLFMHTTARAGTLMAGQQTVQASAKGHLPIEALLAAGLHAQSATLLEAIRDELACALHGAGPSGGKQPESNRPGSG